MSRMLCAALQGPIAEDGLLADSTAVTLLVLHEVLVQQI